MVRRVRAAVGTQFAVAVKLNSADFQRGGFELADAQRVIDMLAPLGVDLVELSGGSYESPAMSGRPADGRTKAREAYFLDLAAELVRSSPLPIMLTGGIARRPVAEEALAAGVAMVGMGSALAVNPDLPKLWHAGADAEVRLAPVRIKNKALASVAAMSRIKHQLRLLAQDRPTSPGVNPLLAFLRDNLARKRALRRYRSWLTAR